MRIELYKGKNRAQQNKKLYYKIGKDNRLKLVDGEGNFVAYLHDLGQGIRPQCVRERLLEQGYDHDLIDYGDKGEFLKFSEKGLREIKPYPGETNKDQATGKRYPAISIYDDLRVVFVDPETGEWIANILHLSNRWFFMRCKYVLESKGFSTDFAEWEPTGSLKKLKNEFIGR